MDQVVIAIPEDDERILGESEPKDLDKVQDGVAVTDDTSVPDTDTTTEKEPEDG